MDKKIPVSEVNWSTSISHQCVEDILVEQELLQPVYVMIVNVCQRNIIKNGNTILNRGTNLSSVPDSYCELEPI